MKVLMSALLVLLMNPVAHAVDIGEETEIVVNGGDVQTEVVNNYYSFGSVKVGHTKSAIFTLRNNNRFPFYIDDIRIQGQGFGEENNCPRLLFGGQHCRLRVGFRPFYPGIYNGLLQIRLTGASDINVYLQGRGTLR